MRISTLLLRVAAFVAIAQFQSVSWSYGGDRLSERERKEFSNSNGSDEIYLNSPSTYIKKIDIDADGLMDLIMVVEGGPAIAYIRTDTGYAARTGMPLRSYSSDPISLSSVEVFALPSNQGARKDVLIRSPRGCGSFIWIGSSLHGAFVRCNFEPETYARLTAECRATGGTWTIGGLAGAVFCERPTRDGGKACFDRSDCEIQCIYKGKEQDRNAAIVGECVSTNRPFGCYTYVRNGKALAATLCVD